jgi:chemotaxis protein CheD
MEQRTEQRSAQLAGAQAAAGVGRSAPAELPPLAALSDTVTVKMAEMEVVADGRSLKTVLGSCVGVIVRDPDRKVSGLAHIMLPARRSDDKASGKYADSAIPALLASMASRGCRAGALQALLVGGAQMFPMGAASIASIGDQNVEAARRVLAERKIPIVFEDIGGTSGRTVVFSNATGRVAVKTLRAITSRGGTP